LIRTLAIGGQRKRGRKRAEQICSVGFHSLFFGYQQGWQLSPSQYQCHCGLRPFPSRIESGGTT
jgi:hypothetical protein